MLSLFLLPLVAVALHYWGMQKTKTRIKEKFSKKISPEYTDSQGLSQAHQIGNMVAIAARYGFYKASCLKRSLLIWFFLSRLGIASTIIIGAQKDNSHDISAHAWVECNGVPVGEEQNVRENFSVFK